MSKPDGGPAFPQGIASTPMGDMYCSWEKHPDFGGMTLRDYFAAAALQGMCADSSRNGAIKVYAEEAYKYADAMLEARK